MSTQSGVRQELTTQLKSEMSANSNHGDSDLGRSKKQQKIDRMLGDAGELIFREVMQGNYGIYVENPGIPDYDFLVGGISEQTGVKVDVKARKGWNNYDDLLVRNKMGGFKADLYVQVIVYEDPDNFTHGIVTGFATREQVQNGSKFSPPGTQHPKKLVNHSDLHPMSEFENFIQMYRDN